MQTDAVVSHRTHMSDRPLAATNEHAELSPTVELARQVIIIINRIGREFTRDLDEAGLAEWSSNVVIGVLSTLSLDGPVRPGALLEPTKLTRGGLSNLLERLENDRLISREYGTVPDDRRGAIVTLTRRGASMLHDINDIYAASTAAQKERFNALGALLGTQPSRGGNVPTPTTVDRLEALVRLGAVLEEMFVTFGGDDPTPARTTIALCAAGDVGGTRPRAVIRETGLSSGGASQLLDRLDEAGLIVRRFGRSPDRRAVIVELTARGRSELERRLRLVPLDRLRRAFIGDDDTPTE